MAISSLKENLCHFNFVWDCILGGEGEEGRGLFCFLDDFLNVILHVHVESEGFMWKE